MRQRWRVTVVRTHQETATIVFHIPDGVSDDEARCILDEEIVDLTNLLDPHWETDVDDYHVERVERLDEAKEKSN